MKRPLPKVRVEERRARFADLYLTGKSLSVCAKELKCGISTLSEDLRHLRTAWQQSAERNVSEKLGEELERLFRVEAAAWRTYERSLKGTTTKTTRSYKGGKTSTVESTSTAGDTKALALAKECVVERLKILGAYPKDGSPQVVIQQIEWDRLYDAPRRVNSVEQQILALREKHDRRVVEGEVVNEAHQPEAPPLPDGG